MSLEFFNSTYNEISEGDIDEEEIMEKKNDNIYKSKNLEDEKVY